MKITIEKPDEDVITGLFARELFLEAGDELVGSDFQRDVLACAAVKRLPVDLANEGDRHTVPILGLGALGLQRCEVLFQLRHARVDVVVTALLDARAECPLVDAVTKQASQLVHVSNLSLIHISEPTRPY